MKGALWQFVRIPWLSDNLVGLGCLVDCDSRLCALDRLAFIYSHSFAEEPHTLPSILSLESLTPSDESQQVPLSCLAM